MSKNHREKIPEKPLNIAMLAAVPVPSVAVPIVSEVDRMPRHRQCPLCWDRCKGVGTVYSTHGQTRYYKCVKTLTDFPPCGHTWTAVVRLEVLKIEHRIVEIDGLR